MERYLRRRKTKRCSSPSLHDWANKFAVVAEGGGSRRPLYYVGRPTKWGNPYKVGLGHKAVEEAVMLFRRDLMAGALPFTVDDVRRELNGRDLAQVSQFRSKNEKMKDFCL